jgi:hypothetical protein
MPVIASLGLVEVLSTLKKKIGSPPGMTAGSTDWLIFKKQNPKGCGATI